MKKEVLRQTKRIVKGIFGGMVVVKRRRVEDEDEDEDGGWTTSVPVLRSMSFLAGGSHQSQLANSLPWSSLLWPLGRYFHLGE
jgi:hypothetical protein